MGLLGRIFGGAPSSRKVHGFIGYFGLADWWTASFSPEERDYIQSKYSPVGYGSEALTIAPIGSTDQTASGFLVGLASWFRSPEDRYLALRMLDAADQLAGSNVLDRHFTYQSMIEAFYRDRDSDPGAIDAAIEACEKQIELGPKAHRAFKRESPGPLPVHVGYKQLVVIRHKQGEVAEAIRLAREAMKSGWRGDWEKRILRYEAQLKKGK